MVKMADSNECIEKKKENVQDDSDNAVKSIPLQEKKQEAELKEGLQKNPGEMRKDMEILKKTVSSVSEEKEKWFKKKEELKQKIADLIRRIKEAKGKSDNNMASIPELKKKRDKCNKEVQALIAEIKQLNKERKEKFGDKDPLEFKREISNLEMQIETQVLPLEKEKGIMKKIKELRKQLKEIGDSSGLIARITDVSKRIEKAKSEAEAFHSHLKEALKGNKQNFKDFKRLSNEITNLKTEQEQAFANFVKFKQEYQAKNKLLKEKLGVLAAISKREGKKRRERKEAEREREETLLKEKAENIEKKFKEKKVLTTEDLLVLQSQKESS